MPTPSLNNSIRCYTFVECFTCKRLQISQRLAPVVVIALTIYEKLKSRIALNSVLETEILRTTVFVSSETYGDDDDQIRGTLFIR